MLQVNYGTQDIFFELKRSSRKTLAIEVYPDGSIVVIAPNDSSIVEIKEKIIRRAQWILKQQQYFEQFLPRTPQREYVSGETHFYLGRGYMLKVIEGNSNEAKLKGGRLLVMCKEKQKSPEKVKKILSNWYYLHAEKKFNSISDTCFNNFKDYNIKKPILEIKRMAKRWGSCNTIDKIVINPEIIKAPTKCIEYLITHEICHLIEKNHTKKFYSLLSEKMPDWQKWKDRLEQKMS